MIVWKVILIIIFLYQTYLQRKNNIIFQNGDSFLQKGDYLIINELYHMFNKLLYRNNSFSNINANYYINYNFSKNNNSKNLLCTIGKNENLYAKEFVEYYYALGFDKIIIFDNNDFNGENFYDVLKNYISQKIVDIINVRGLKYIQVPSFYYCYKKNMYLYDWIAFFDFDEYLFIENKLGIKNYLSNNFKNCQSILFNWYEYNDNDLLRYDNRTLNKRFNTLKSVSNMTKFMVRGNLNDFLIFSLHLPSNINYCNSKGEVYKPTSFKNLPREFNSKAYIKHFRTKTAEEYCNKLLRGDAQFGSFSKYKLYRKINRYFFSLNKKTPEKINIFQKCLKITNITDFNSY